MSSIEAAEVRRIAHLARLSLSERDEPGYARDLSAILDLFAAMDAQDTTDVEPMAHPLDEVQPLRVDEITESSHRERYQAVAPSVDSRLYLVPRVIE